MKPYYIEFNVSPDKKSIQTITVRLDSEVVTDDKAVMNIDLVSHPLYAALERYVLANPAPKITNETTSKH